MRVVIDLVKVLHNLVPRSVADVFQDDDRRLVLLDPLQHASERPTGFTIRFDVLLLVVKVGIVDTRCTGDEDLPESGWTRMTAGQTHVNITRHGDERSIGRVCPFLPELCHIAEQDGRRKVALNVRLLEWFDLAGEDVVKSKSQSVLRLDGFGDHVERQQR